MGLRNFSTRLEIGNRRLVDVVPRTLDKRVSEMDWTPPVKPQTIASWLEVGRPDYSNHCLERTSVMGVKTQTVHEKP
ncbi:hypothetical protein RRG08_008481 [Elysia crispata]|uniref:Uncharacterized protein n=1 Tax=Elysia crispata TaxID=231223 RepID=A0AAE0Z960_9GAST|nr:hypothetical protein RRG08_008481 [Elysia crispata]